jgi:hypothetical protein
MPTDGMRSASKSETSACPLATRVARYTMMHVQGTRRNFPEVRRRVLEKAQYGMRLHDRNLLLNICGSPRLADRKRCSTGARFLIRMSLVTHDT